MFQREDVTQNFVDVGLIEVHTTKRAVDGSVAAGDVIIVVRRDDGVRTVVLTVSVREIHVRTQTEGHVLLVVQRGDHVRGRTCVRALHELDVERISLGTFGQTLVNRLG